MLKIYIINTKKPLNEYEFKYFLKFVQAGKKERILRQIKKQNSDNMLIGEILAKISVKKAFGVDIASQSFSYTEKKKPYLKNFPNVHFNISHSEGYAVCAVADRQVGTDIQKIKKYNPKTAKKICTKEELKKIESSSDKDGEFTKIWTKKEAFLKMSGEGITLKNIENCLKGKNVKSVKIADYYLSWCVFEE